MNTPEPAQTVAPIDAPMPQPESPPASTPAAAPAPSSPVSGVAPHSLTEDAFALCSATLLIALGVGAWQLWHDPAGRQWTDARWHALLGRLGMEQQAAGSPARPDKYGDSPRTMADCIKPGNLIDDEVRACVKGYRVKTW